MAHIFYKVILATRNYPYISLK